MELEIRHRAAPRALQLLDVRPDPPSVEDVDGAVVAAEGDQVRAGAPTDPGGESETRIWPIEPLGAC